MRREPAAHGEPAPSLQVCLSAYSVRTRPRRLALDSPLTEEEKQVLKLLAAGRTGMEIAAEISPETVRTHIQSILTKLGVHSRLDGGGNA